jgi:hypothetical protein
MRSNILLTPLLVLLLVAPALGGPKLTKDEKAAIKTCEKELLKLAKFAAKGKDFAAAKDELKRGLEISSDSSKLKKELGKVEKKAAKSKKGPKESFAEKLEEKRTEAHAAVAMALANAALATETEAPERYTGYLELIQTRYPSKEALAALNLVYFKPYFRWVSGTEAKILESGGDRLGDKLLKPEEVAGLNGQHSDWDNPWILTDGVHELRTTVSLRQANQILYYVTAYRKYFLARFSSWDLRAPKGKLPIIVTKTQAELKAQMKVVTDKMGGGGGAGMNGIQGAAYYLYTNSDLNPCFVTYEPTEAGGTTFSIDNFEQLQIPIAHEVTHQIVFEYSKYDCNRMRAIENHFWAVEAIANYMGYHVFDDTSWKLTHPRTIQMGRGLIEGPFAHCVQNVSSLPNLALFMGQSRQQFLTVNNYHYAATLAYFLLEGQGGKYRERFITFLSVIHKTKDEAKSFAKAFPGVDLDALHAEWMTFVRKITLD